MDWRPARSSRPHAPPRARAMVRVGDQCCCRPSTAEVLRSRSVVVVRRGWVLVLAVEVHELSGLPSSGCFDETSIRYTKRLGSCTAGTKTPRRVRIRILVVVEVGSQAVSSASPQQCQAWSCTSTVPRCWLRDVMERWPHVESAILCCQARLDQRHLEPEPSQSTSISRSLPEKLIYRSDLLKPHSLYSTRPLKPTRASDVSN